MSVVASDLLFVRHLQSRRKPVPKLHLVSERSLPFLLSCRKTPNRRAKFCSRHFSPVNALGSSGATDVEISESSNVTFARTFHLKRPEKLEGKITIRLDGEKNEEYSQLTVGCSLPGKWVLHWGVNYLDDVGSEWDQPPLNMRPPGSVPIKDYAIETPFERSPALLEGEAFYEVKIDINTSTSIATINFVLKDEESGYWYQHRGRDFKVPLIEFCQDDSNVVGAKKGFGIWSGCC